MMLTRSLGIFQDYFKPFLDARDSLSDEPVPVLRALSLDVELWLVSVISRIRVTYLRVDGVQRVSHDD